MPLNHNRGVASGSRFRLEKELKWVGQDRTLKTVSNHLTI